MSETTTETTTEVEADKDLIKFSPVQAQLKAMKAENAKLSFKLEDAKELEAAKKHVKHLKTIKKAVVATHKEVKAEALAFGRKVDAVKNELMADVEEMIDLHEDPIKEIKAKEDKRIETHANNVADIRLPDALPTDLDGLKKLQQAITDTIVDETWEEYQEPGEMAKKLSLDLLLPHVERAQKFAEQEAKIKEMEKEKADREKADLEAAEELKAKEAERLRIEQEKKDEENRKFVEAERVRLEKEAKEQAEAQAIIDKGIAEKEKAEAIEQAKKDEAERIENERKAKEAADKEAKEKRLADEAHVTLVKDQAASAIAGEVDITANTAMIIVSLIESGKIPNVSIKF